MRHAVFENRVALRIDIDFATGLDRAVPFFVDALKQHDMRASFFVVSGRNRPGSLLRRLVTPGYLSRIRRLGPLRIARSLGLGDRGDFLDRESRRRIVARIEASGNEVVVHGFDHAWWADHVWTAAPERIAKEIDRGFDAMREALGHDLLAWGSPNWRTTPDVLQMLHRRGVPYLAECWGTSPFNDLDPCGAILPLVHLPVTTPSLETRFQGQEEDPNRVIASLLDARPADRYDMICVHDYFEGLMHPSLFRSLLDYLARRGWQGVTLRELASGIEEANLALPTEGMTRGPLPGFTGLVNWQAGALR